MSDEPITKSTMLFMDPWRLELGYADEWALLTNTVSGEEYELCHDDIRDLAQLLAAAMEELEDE